MREWRGIKAVLFDLGGTLVKTAPQPEIIRRILEDHGVKMSVADISSAHKKAEKNLTLEDYGLPYYDFWVKWNKKILKELQICDNTELLARVLVDEWWDNADVELYQEVKDVLVRLRKVNLKIGIVTNAFKKDIEDILSRICLTDFFDATIGIDSVGKPKPSREIFLHALKVLNIQPYEALFVGDDVEKDYFGALKAGLKAVLIDRNCIFKEDVAKIRDLKDLLKFVNA